MRTLPPLAALLFGVSALTASAETAMPLTYDTFEVAVPHVDLEECPPSLQAAETFCRATLANDAIHVFAFAEGGDSPLIGFTSFAADSLPALLN
jgi:hypothetical protein